MEKQKTVMLVKKTDLTDKIWWFIKDENGWNLDCKSNFSDIKPIFDRAVSNLKKYAGDRVEVVESITINNPKIIVWKDGSYKKINDGLTYEFENDVNYLVTIPL